MHILPSRRFLHLLARHLIDAHGFVTIYLLTQKLVNYSKLDSEVSLQLFKSLKKIPITPHHRHNIL